MGLIRPRVTAFAHSAAIPQYHGPLYLGTVGTHQVQPHML